MIARDNVYSAVRLVFSSTVCLILCLFQTNQFIKYSSLSFHLWLHFNWAVYYLRQLFQYSGCVSWQGWLNLSVHSREHLTMQWFLLDLGLTTVEQCPCLAPSIRMTEAKKNLSKAKSPPTQCTHHAHTLSSSHQCTLLKSNTTQQRSLFKHHIASPSCESKLQRVKGETIKVKSSLIEWTTPKQLASTPNLWTFLWKTRLEAQVQVPSRVTT